MIAISRTITVGITRATRRALTSFVTTGETGAAAFAIAPTSSAAFCTLIQASQTLATDAMTLYPMIRTWTGGKTTSMRFALG